MTMLFLILIFVSFDFVINTEVILPPFLDAQPKTVTDKWLTMQSQFSDKNDGQIQSAIDEFLSQHPGVRPKYEEFERGWREELEKLVKIRNARLMKLSSAAREIDRKLTAIGSNPTMTQKNKEKDIHDLFESNFYSVRYDLIDSLSTFQDNYATVSESLSEELRTLNQPITDEEGKKVLLAKIN